MTEEEEEEEIMIMEELEEKMSTTASNTTTTTFLPQEIVMEILSWLPAKSLINSLKLVCKDWHTIIKDPDFVKMHLNRGGGGGRRISSNNHHSLICKSSGKFSGNELFQLHTPFNYDGVPIPAGAKKLDFDLLSSLSSRSRLVGSCNGLLCLSVVNDDENIIILNPSTRKYKVSPKQPMIENHSPFKLLHPPTYGFGCCNNSNNTTIAIDDDEYKGVRIAYIYCYLNSLNPSFQYQIDIYSMSSNSWRRRRRGIKDFPVLISRYRPAVFLNGALHWTGSSIRHVDLRDVLISFDMRDEDFGPVAMPPCVVLDKPTRDKIREDKIREDKILINLRGCLGMICVTICRSSMCWDFDIWVMKEYGIRESWTRECVIRSSDTDPPGALSGFTIAWNTKACFLIGDQILIDKGYGRMALYDMNSKKIDGDFKIVGVKAPIAGVKSFPDVDLADHIETLVSLKSSQLPS